MYTILPGKDRPAAGTGFTLIELLVVLAISALLLGLALPYFWRSVPATTERAAAMDLRAVLRSAGEEAVTHGRTVVFRPDPSGGYWIDQRHMSLAGAAGARMRLIAGPISFYPWGGSSGGRIWIEGPEGRQEILIDPVTGHANAAP